MNQAGTSGAVNIYEGTVHQCIFSGNSAEVDGGAIQGGNRLVISDCILSNNSSNRYGGGMFFSECQYLAIDRCLFEGNTAIEGGACEFWSVQSFETTNCIWTGNRAFTHGGALFIGGTYSGSIINNTFYDNHAELSGGAVIAFNTNESLIRNTVFWLNNASEGSDIVVTDEFGAGMPARVLVDHTVLVRSNCKQEGSECSIEFGERVIEENPCLSDPENLEFSPCRRSNCIDTGSVNGSPHVDFKGDLRPVGSGIDIGAIEVQEVFDDGFHIIMENSNVTAGDPFRLDMLSVVHNQPMDVEGVLILEIGGLYYYYPEWKKELALFDVPIQYNRWESNVFNFQWPDNLGSMSGLCFWGGLINAESKQLFGQIHNVYWSYY